MKMILLTLIICMISASLRAPYFPDMVIVVPEADKPYEAIWSATCGVESDYNPMAVNLTDPNGGSYGIAQIGQLKLNEYNAANRTAYKLKDCFDVAVSKRIFMWHIIRYKDWELAVMRWNGSGPKTIEYLKLIKTHMYEKT